MIRTILGIVLGDEDRGVLPELGVRYGVDQQAEGVIVIGDIGPGHRSAWKSPSSVVVRQPHQLDRRECTGIRLIGRKLSLPLGDPSRLRQDRKSTRLNSSHTVISYAVFCLKKKKKNKRPLSATNEVR